MPDFPASGFEGLEQAQRWVHGFVQWYNHEHRHSAIRFVTPVQRHTGEEVAILSRRHALTQAARTANPERWSGQTTELEQDYGGDFKPGTQEAC